MFVSELHQFRRWTAMVLRKGRQRTVSAVSLNQILLVLLLRTLTFLLRMRIMKAKRTKRSKILAMEGNPPSFRAERKNLRTFYSRESNQLTRANPFSVGTVDKMVERILGFMYFCLNIKALTTDISLSLFNYVHLFTSYIEYLRDTGSSCRLPHN